MNTNTRKICQFCRYKSCLSIGMKPKWVLSDDERHQKYGNRRKNKQQLSAPLPTTITENSNQINQQQQIELPIYQVSSKSNLQQQYDYKTDLQNQLDEQSSSNNHTHTSNSDDESPSDTSTQAPTHTQSDIKRLGIDGINTCVKNANYSLNSYEKDLIDRLSIAFYHSRKYNSMDLNLQKKLAVLFQTQNQGSLKKISKVILANFIVQPVKRVITFAKLVPDFLKLELNDQMCLLQGGTMEIFICSSSSMYDAVSNKINNVVSRDRNIEGQDQSSVQLDILRLIWSEEVFERTISFLKSMSELKLDEATLILFVPIILFSPDRRGLKDRAKILDIQSKYSLLLKKYMFWKYGYKKETVQLFNRLLLKLVDLRTLHELHSSILLDADPAHLDPFPLALLTTKKEELTKIKSTVEPIINNNVNEEELEARLHASELNETATPPPRRESDSELTNVKNHSSSSSSGGSGGSMDKNLNILTPASSFSSGQISSSVASVSPPPSASYTNNLSPPITINSLNNPNSLSGNESRMEASL